MKKSVIIFSLLMALAVITSGYAQAEDPVVYFTSDISAEGLVRIYEALNWAPTGKVAVKISTGEPPASNYLRPELIGEDEVMIPVVATLRCGFGRTGEAVYKDQRPVPSSYLKRWGDEIVFYEAVGESMSPTITPGDLLVTVPGPAWEDGWIVVVDVNDSDTIKRIYRSKEDGGVDLVPDNKKYKPMHLTPAELAEYNVAVLGHVVKPIGPDL